MASRTAWVSWGVLLLGLSAAVGCDDEREPFPPPQPYPGGTIGAQGGAGGTGAGGAGAGGATGGTTSTGTPTTLNLCECTFGMVDSPACGACANDAVAPGKACEAFDVACKTDPACDELFKCKLACVGKPDAEQVTCIQACYGQVDLTSPDNHAFVNLTDCLCKGCAIKCAPSMAIACE